MCPSLASRHSWKGRRTSGNYMYHCHLTYVYRQNVITPRARVNVTWQKTAPAWSETMATSRPGPTSLLCLLEIKAKERLIHHNDFLLPVGRLTKTSLKPIKCSTTSPRLGLISEYPISLRATCSAFYCTSSYTNL